MKNNQGGSQKKSKRPSRNQAGLGSRDDPIPEDNCKSPSLSGLLFSLWLSLPTFFGVGKNAQNQHFDTITKRNSTPSHMARNQIWILFMLFKSVKTTSSFLLQRFPCLSPSLWQACGKGRSGCVDMFRDGMIYDKAGLVIGLLNMPLPTCLIGGL